jgi:hypothetical protein
MGGCGEHRLTGNGEPVCLYTVHIYKDVLKLAYEDYVTQKSPKDTAANEA